MEKQPDVMAYEMVWRDGVAVLVTPFGEVRVPHGGGVFGREAINAWADKIKAAQGTDD